MEPIIEFEGTKSRGILLVEVVGELCYVEVLGPILLAQTHIMAKIIFQYLISPLRLTICLWVIGTTKLKVSTHQSKKCGPKFTGEATITIANYLSWEPMVFEHICKEKFRHILGIRGAFVGHKVSILRKSIHDYEDTRVVLAFRQAYDEVHAKGFPRLIRDA